jgi:hypothetical protein
MCEIISMSSNSFNFHCRSVDGVDNCSQTAILSGNRSMIDIEQLEFDVLRVLSSTKHTRDIY